jgi:hypothetical protein
MAPADDHTRNFMRGFVIVREGGNGLPWLVTWLPHDRDDPSFPGATLSSTEEQVPEGPGVEDMFAWVMEQPWSQPKDVTIKAPPAGGTRLDEPGAWDALRDAKEYEHAVEFRWTQEPDGGYSWALYSPDQLRLQHGFAATWDDARLAMIENLFPPSSEE